MTTLCRHKVELCFRCGVYPVEYVNRRKITSEQIKQKQAVAKEQRLAVEQKHASRKQIKAACNYLSPEVASLSCGCAGVRSLFECRKHPDKIIMRTPLSKPNGKILGTGQVITMQDCHACSSCDDYQPTEGT